DRVVPAGAREGRRRERADGLGPAAPQGPHLLLRLELRSLGREARPRDAPPAMRALTACLALAGLAGAQDAAPTGDASYWVYVAAESADEVWKVVFDGERAAVAGVVDVGSLPTEIEGPHGLAVDPQSGSWFVTLAHGMPFGRVCRYDCATD